MRKMKIVSDISTKAELDEFKSIMEIFVVNQRIKELAELVANSKS